jgi:glycine/D-amino acid oxidase-like deaminating enzyme
VDRHPQIDNVWLLGGGSGHGFKHGPAMGEIMAELILEKRESEPAWRLSRFDRKK